MDASRLHTGVNSYFLVLWIAWSMPENFSMMVFMLKVIKMCVLAIAVIKPL